MSTLLLHFSLFLSVPVTPYTVSDVFVLQVRVPYRELSCHNPLSLGARQDIQKALRRKAISYRSLAKGT